MSQTGRGGKKQTNLSAAQIATKTRQTDRQNWEYFFGGQFVFFKVEERMNGH